MKQNIFLAALLLTALQGFAQSFDLHIAITFGKEPIAEDKWYVSAKGDSIQFDNVRFYLSNIEFEKENGTTFKDAQKAHLIDFLEPSTLNISLQNIDYKDIKTMRFNIGIDSTTSVAGALGGDLDPQKGMYWAWQSGYINMKIEGRSPQCPNRKNVFQFHIGGYMQPFYAMRRVELTVTQIDRLILNHPINDAVQNPKYTEGVILTLDLSKFFEKINIHTQNSMMIPSKEAMQLADLSVQMFSINAHEK